MSPGMQDVESKRRRLLAGERILEATSSLTRMRTLLMCDLMSLSQMSEHSCSVCSMRGTPGTPEEGVLAWTGKRAWRGEGIMCSPQGMNPMAV